MASSHIRYGSCLCGTVKYSATGQPFTNVLCHCNNCQKASGSSFQANIIYAKENFHLLRGQDNVHTYHDSATDSGATLARSFCSICGSTLFTTNETNPALSAVVIVATGTLDGEKDFVPDQEFYCKGKFAFVPQMQGTKEFETM